MSALIPVLITLLMLLFVVAIHEAGHYIAAGIAGVPARDRRIVLFGLPPHLLLRHDDGWATPFQNDRYRVAYGRHDPTRRHARLFTAAGLLAQTLVVPVGILLVVAGFTIGQGLIRLSLNFYIVYVIWDLVATAIRGRPFGDTTQLWRLSPVYTIIVVAFFTGVHVLGLWIIAAL